MKQLLSKVHNTLERPQGVSDQHWQIFIAVLEGYRNGPEIAEQYNVTRKWINYVFHDVRDAVEAAGQVVPKYDQKMDTWMADDHTKRIVEEMAGLYPGGYHQVMREAVLSLANDIREYAGDVGLEIS